MTVYNLPTSTWADCRTFAYAKKLCGAGFCLLLAASVLTACGSDNDGTTSVRSDNGDSTGAVQPQFGNRTIRDFDPQIDTDTQAQVIDSFNQLSLQLLREQSDLEPGVNTINSGFGLAIAMSMLQRGTADSDFNFIQQLLNVSAIDEDAFYNAINAIDLELESRTNEGLEFRSANQLFVKPGFTLETDFLDVMTGQFDAPISNAQFATQPEAVRKAINEWGAENTNDLIPDLLPQPLPNNTVVALLNATLLDAKWRQNFSDVSNLEFTNVDGQVQSVPGFSGNSTYQFLETDDAQSVSIAYEGSELSLMIVVPEDIETYTANLTTDTVSQRDADAQPAYLALTVPNWTTASSIDFTRLPMTSDLAGRALNMTRMSRDNNCCNITQFKQEAIIEVDKDGTRAAAITIVGVGTTSLPPVPRVVNIDRPFVFMIRDEPTGLILFSGRVLSL